MIVIVTLRLVPDHC